MNLIYAIPQLHEALQSASLSLRIDSTALSQYVRVRKKIKKISNRIAIKIIKTTSIIPTFWSVFTALIMLRIIICEHNKTEHHVYNDFEQRIIKRMAIVFPSNIATDLI